MLVFLFLLFFTLNLFCIVTKYQYELIIFKYTYLFEQLAVVQLGSWLAVLGLDVRGSSIPKKLGRKLQTNTLSKKNGRKKNVLEILQVDLVTLLFIILVLSYPVRGAPKNGVTPTVTSRITNEFQNVVAIPSLSTQAIPTLILLS